MTRTTARSRTIVLTCLLAGLTIVAATASESGNDLAEIVGEILGTEPATVFETDLRLDAPDSFEVEVPLEGDVSRLTLDRSSVRAADFRLLVETASGEIEERPAPEPRTYRGRLDSDPDSLVTASLDIDGRLHAVIRRSDEAIFEVQPLDLIAPGATPGQHAVVRVDTASGLIGGMCGTLDPVVSEELVGPVPEQPRSSRGTGLKLCDIAFDCDFEFFQLNNGNVNNTLRDVERIMGGVRAIYEMDVQITYEVTVVLVRTAEPDPYTSNDADTLLGEFRSHWNGSLGAIRRDVAHLMTGKMLILPTIGIARVATICNKSGAYGLSQSRFTPLINSRIALTAHELGHNWSAGHCSGGDCRIMCSSIGGCSGDISRFGAQSQAAIGSFRDSRTCLEDLAPSVEAPFFDSFPGSSIDRSLWSYVEGAKTSNSGGPKPSEPRALNLDAANANDFKDDEIRSNFIRLGDARASYASFFVNHKGVEAGEALVVEYFSFLGLWEPVDRIVSDGTDPARYRFRAHKLPPFARHDKFRIRFRSEVDQGNDDWFVDDVRVCPSPVSIKVTPDANVIRAGQNLFFEVEVENLTDQRQPYTAWLDAFRSDGKAFSGNPVFGPTSRSLAPNRKISKRTRIRIPDSAPPSGPHLIRVALGNFPEPCAVATFEITVVR